MKARCAYAQQMLDEIRDARWSAKDGSLSIGGSKPRILKRVGARISPDADRWVAPEIELLELSDLMTLPEIGGNACRPGVYFLFLKGQLQYVGSARNVRARVLNHDFYQEISFDSATYLPVPWPWQMALEALYIRRYGPPMNTHQRQGGSV